MSRPTLATIDGGALRHNLRRVRQLAPSSRVFCVVKANAYGHDLATVATTLEPDTDAFAVAAIEEALVLRASGVGKPVLLLEGVFESNELTLCSQYQFAVAVHHAEQLRMLELARLQRPLAAWLKIDSGMHRLGFAPSTVVSAWKRLNDCDSIGHIHLMSHMACADEPGASAAASTWNQLGRFDDAFKQLHRGSVGAPFYRSMAN